MVERSSHSDYFFGVLLLALQILKEFAKHGYSDSLLQHKEVLANIFSLIEQ